MTYLALFSVLERPLTVPSATPVSAKCSFLVESCFLCGGFVWRSTTVCSACRQDLMAPDLIFSAKGGLPYFSLFHYNRDSSGVIRLCKAATRNRVNRVLGKILAEKYALEGYGIVRAVVPMPPKIKGGHDHAYLIAAEVADFFGATLLADVLERGERAEPGRLGVREQKAKSRDERRRIKVGASAGVNLDLKPHEIILLVDDVATTGATLFHAWTALNRPPAVGLTLASRPLVL